ncbi:proline dehydrogenase family protein [Nonomuraea longicatena]|uniref:Proline dehydrogenase family protein n=1 Tax=Nonomuraea longicatena TaxID=83682 RepID=A0ABN1QDA0_9ACTN
MGVLRQVLLAAAKSDRVERALSTIPTVRKLAGRYVAEDVAAAVADLSDRGLRVTVGRLGPEVLDRAQAEGAVRGYLALLDRLPEGSDVSVRLTVLGLRMSEQLALDNAASLCEAAAGRGLTITLDAEEHDTVAGLHSVHATLRKEHADVGVAVQAHLRDAEERCLRLDGARVRLCKGAHTAPGAFTTRKEVDRSFVRCLKILMAGTGYPMVATHDPRLVEIASALAVLNGRDAAAFEYQMYYGVRPGEQERLATLGAQLRVYVPHGTDWYPYLVRRLAFTGSPLP